MSNLTPLCFNLLAVSSKRTDMFGMMCDALIKAPMRKKKVGIATEARSM